MTILERLSAAQIARLRRTSVLLYSSSIQRALGLRQILVEESRRYVAQWKGMIQSDALVP